MAHRTEGVSVEAAVAAAVLRKAKADALHGDGIALLWLATTGVELADGITPDGGDYVRRWVERRLSDVGQTG